MSAHSRTDHQCPHPHCTERIPNRLYACALHWRSLSKPVRDAIYATRGLYPMDPARLGALRAAREEWGSR